MSVPKRIEALPIKGSAEFGGGLAAPETNHNTRRGGESFFQFGVTISGLGRDPTSPVSHHKAREVVRNTAQFLLLRRLLPDEFAPREIFFMLRAMLIAFALLTGVSQSARAVDVETLPKGVRMSQARFGVISGLDQTWAKDGKLYDLGETRSVTFDAATLARVNERARALVQALDYFGNHDLGEKIQLGTLNVQTTPQLQFFAPVLAYGLSDSWTLGIGVPVVRYQNTLTLSASNSNLAFYRQQFQGISHQLDDALNLDLVAEAQKVIAEKGYRRLENRDETFVADMQVALLHRLGDLGSWSFLHQIAVTVPTGPKDDPDDLMSLNAFGRTALGNTIIAARQVARRLIFLPYLGLDLPIPDRVVKRIPKNDDDNLPDQDSKQEIGRFLAPMATLGSELRWAFTNRWDAKYGVEGSAKGKDRYEGTGRTDLLEKNTDSEVLRVRGGLSYSTVEDYKIGKSMAPTRVSLEVADTVAGRNIERQLRTELAAMLFF